MALRRTAVKQRCYFWLLEIISNLIFDNNSLRSLHKVDETVEVVSANSKLGSALILQLDLSQAMS